MSFKKLLVAVLVVVAVALAVIPQSVMTPEQARTLGIVLVTLSLWATGLVPAYLASLIFMAVTLVLKLAPPMVVFSGFYSSAMWLVFSGFVIAAAVRGSGLSTRLAGLGIHIAHSHALVISGLFAIAMVLTFVMPSSLGRFFLLSPLAMALADRIGYGEGTKGRTAVAIATTLACHVPGFTILPSNVPNLVLTGAAQTIYNFDLTYAEYTLLHFPILGLLKSIIMVALIVWLFPDAPRPAESDGTDETTPRLGWRQWYVIAVLVITLGFWMTDTFHGVNPAWVGICASIALIWPGIGPVGQAEFDKTVNFGVLLFMAGILAVGALVNATGLGAVIAHGMEHILPLSPGADFLNFVSLSAMAFITGIFTTLPGVPAVLTPMAGELSDLTGLSLFAVLMTQVIGFSTVFFPYQSAPLMVGMQVARQPVSALLKITVPLTVITFLVLLPLDFLWWRLLGVL
ncbi:SLC13 family permease [Martelella endophytica]|uniref:Sodium:sulfate symporter n=1 Tax=Martelella endophytica TaxID=1486262 RepID=A0A0D5LQE4_MAREN|nr:SLC13 family permease [Martelella endophytica]AJY45982.1 sodium:sulfate symporter [Martelella endophytica]